MRSEGEKESGGNDRGEQDAAVPSGAEGDEERSEAGAEQEEEESGFHADRDATANLTSRKGRAVTIA